MKKYLLITALFISLISSSFAITKEEEAKMTKIEKMRLMAMRGNTYGMFGWEKELNLNNSFLGCLDKNGILIMNKGLLDDICNYMANYNDTPTCSEKEMARFRKLKGDVVFVDSKGYVAPYFRPLTKEEVYELFGDRGTPVCISYEFY